MICIFLYTATSELKCIGYVDDYDKNRYLEKIWKAAICSPHVTAWVR